MRVQFHTPIKSHSVSIELFTQQFVTV